MVWQEFCEAQLRQIVHLGQNNPMQQNRLGTGHIENSFAEKKLEVLMNCKLKENQKCPFATVTVNFILGCIKECGQQGKWLVCSI